MRCSTLVVLLAFAIDLKADEPKADQDLKLSEDEKLLVESTNAERTQAKLSVLQPNTLLMSVARAHAANMAKQEILSHDLDGLSASDRLTKAGYGFQRSGENIGWNFPSPKAAVLGWMNSSGHRDNILGPDYTEVGVAMARNSKGEPYWVQVFATPRKR